MRNGLTPEAAKRGLADLFAEKPGVRRVTVEPKTTKPDSPAPEFGTLKLVGGEIVTIDADKIDELRKYVYLRDKNNKQVYRNVNGDRITLKEDILGKLKPGTRVLHRNKNLSDFRKENLYTIKVKNAHANRPKTKPYKTPDLKPAPEIQIEPITDLSHVLKPAGPQPIPLDIELRIKIKIEIEK